MKFIEYFSYILIPLIILGILVYGLIKREKVYELFVDGATDGLKVILNIFPAILAIIVAINVFRESGAMDLLIRFVSPISNFLGIPNEVMPLGVMSSVSGGASLGLLSDVLEHYGPDSLIGRIASTIMGSSETTLYVLAVYVGCVGIKHTRQALYIGLICDFVAMFSAVWLCRFF